MFELTTLNLHEEYRDDSGVNLNQQGVSLSAGLAALGMGTFVDSNENVNERTALEVPTYLACVRILSESVATLPLRVYEKLPRGQRPAPNHYLYYMLSQRPNPQMSAKVFFSTLMVSAVGWSNAYARIERDGSGRPIALWPLLPWKTKPVRKDGVLTFQTTDSGSGQTVTIASEDMVHVVGFSLDGILGTSLVRMARQCIGLALVAARFGARFYSNGARNSFFLQADHDLTPEELTNMRLDVEALSTGANQWRVANLPNGVKVVDCPSDPNALTEYINTTKLTRDQIAALMRVPGYMVGSTEKVLKSTVEAQNREFLSYSLQPWIVGIEQELQYKLLPSTGRTANQYVLRFYLDALLAADTLTQTAKQTAGRMGGWLSANDVREQLGMEPIPGGDEYLVPLNTAPASEAVVPEETDADPEDSSPDGKPADPAARAAQKIIVQGLKTKTKTLQPQPRALFKPLFEDAFSRLSHRSRQDSAAITQALSPVCASIGAFYRSGDSPGRAEQKAVDKYLSGLESRFSSTTPEAEFSKLVRSLIFATEEDSAEIRAKSKLQVIEV